MLPVGAEEAGKTHDASAAPVKAREEVPIEGDHETLVDPSDPIPNPPPPERGLLGNEVVPEQRIGTVPRRDPDSDVTILVVHEHTVAVDQVYLRVLGEVPGHVGER